jgi:aspartate aminotransferase/aminotransferase
MHDHWIAARMRLIDASGIRKVFDLARSLKDPINLSIGLPHFDVPDSVKAACKTAIDQGRNAYTVTQGIAELRERLAERLRRRFPTHADRDVFVTSGTSGGLLLALHCAVNPGDEVILFDPYFVMYPHLVNLVGGVPKFIDTYPDFAIDVNRVQDALTPKTKMVIVNSPANPTGAVHARQTLRDLAVLCRDRRVLLLSDEVYSCFCHDSEFVSPAEFNEDVLVLDGLSKSHAMTGWRLGWASGPKPLIQEMIKLQQFSFVCAPSMVQYAALAALDCDVSAYAADYRQKRDRLVEALSDQFEIAAPGGAFYMFPKAPWGTGTEFVAEAIRNNLLVIPGATFSRRDTHFRISYAASDATIERGIDILRTLARGKA